MPRAAYVGDGRDSRDGRAFIEVADSGPGIPAAERERVFDRFYRWGDDGPGQPGSGLGLSIVRTIADRHNAHVVLADSASGGLLARVVYRGAAEAARSPV